MLFKKLLKMKKFICMLIMICIMIPLVAACTDTDNTLKDNAKNTKIGYGGDIEAYTTYAQANLIEMDKDTYYSYLLTGRDFILTVLPKDPDEDTVYSKNLMFQAIYNGVTPYSEQIVNGNFTFENPQYKILIYYVVADDFLKWDEDAMNKVDGSKNFVSKALDLMGPASNDYEHDVQNRLENYTLKNVVNLNSYISECYFLRTKDGNVSYNSSTYGKDWDRISTKCGDNAKRGNVIADVKNASDKTRTGVTLLYSGGGLNGYFSYSDVLTYDLSKNAMWLSNLISEYGSLKNMILKLTENLSTEEKNAIFKDITEDDYATQMEYKLKYDLSLLGRIKTINYNTLLDIYTTTDNVKSINTIQSADEYKKYIAGNENANNGNYIAFTTADGFVIDRGNIVLEAAADALYDMNILEQFTNMDACTNRTIASYFAEVLADIGIVVGGLAVGAGAVAAVATTLVAVGAVSSSVPVIGWIIGAACLFAAGIATLAVSISTKKAINETSSANYCKIYKEALEEVISGEYIKLPIYHYEIPSDGTSTELCYTNMEINPETGKTQCGYLDANGNFVKKASIPAFKNASTKIFDSLGDLTGSPSLRLYRNGKVVDEIYGVASTQFIISILDSWGVTASSNMKFFAQANNVDDDLQTKTINIYNLLAKAKEEDKIKAENAYYCISEKYEKRCYASEGGIQINDLSALNSENGILTFTTDIAAYNNFANAQRKKIDASHVYDFDKAKNAIKNAVEEEYSKIVQNVEKTDGKYYVYLYNEVTGMYDNKYEIVIDDENSALMKNDGETQIASIQLVNKSGYYQFEYNNIIYKLTTVTTNKGELDTYRVTVKEYISDSADSPFNSSEIKTARKHIVNNNSFLESFNSIIENSIYEMREKATSKDTILKNIDSSFSELKGKGYYTEYIDAFINITIQTGVADKTNYHTASNFYKKNMAISLVY